MTNEAVINYCNYRKRKRKIIVASFLFCFSLFFIIGHFITNSETRHQPKLEEVVVETTMVQKPTKLMKVQQLYQQNDDMVGWLTIPGTRIDYPVMYTPGQDYYLYHDFYKKKYNSGTLYIDKHNNVGLRDINLIIHGHNMLNGSMFHDLEKYKTKEFYQKHKTFTFYTISEEQEYEIIAAFNSRVYGIHSNAFKYYQFYDAKDQIEYQNFLFNIQRLAFYQTGVTAQYPEELITLSTCENYSDNGRIVVVAKRIR